MWRDNRNPTGDFWLGASKMQFVRKQHSSMATATSVAPLAVAMLAMVLLFAGPVPAAMLVVNSTDDPGDGACDAAECTLREALQEAAGDGQSDSITFDLRRTARLCSTAVL
jgi:CSLREA domain-containing protein